MNVDTPECDRLREVASDSNKLGFFLDWLNEQGIRLGRYEWQRPCTHEAGPTLDGWTRKWQCRDGRYVGHHLSNAAGEDGGECDACHGTGQVEANDPPLTPHGEPYERLLARYFNIDLDKLEAERRQVLEAFVNENT